MKQKLILIALFFGVFGQILAQNCPQSEAAELLIGPQVRGNINANGVLFGSNSGDTDANGLFPFFNNSPAGSPTSIFNASLWVGGLDPAGNLLLTAEDYFASGSDAFTPGPLDLDGAVIPSNCANWDKVFVVSGAQILAHIADKADDGIVQNKQNAIYGWPAKGNPHFFDKQGFNLPTTVQGLAPFFDANQNGNYEPEEGDYPVVALRTFTPFVPDGQIAWAIFNDAGRNTMFSPTRFEFQLTAFTMDCANHPVLDNTVFTSYKLINRSPEKRDSLFVGFFVDFDLGCYLDDNIGTYPLGNTVFAYNTDLVDGNVGTNCDFNLPTFGNNPPVAAMTFLNAPLSKSIYFNNSAIGTNPLATTEPSTPIEYYQYLNARFRDGTPITTGGSGYNPTSSTTILNHIFPDSPLDVNGWSMSTANQSIGDRRMIASTKIGEFFPGQVHEITAAWSAHNAAGDAHLNYNSMVAGVGQIQSLFDADLSQSCMPLNAETLDETHINIYPNPTNSALFLNFGAINATKITLFDVHGRAVFSQNINAAETQEMQIGHLLEGVYFLQIYTLEGELVRRIVRN